MGVDPAVHLMPVALEAEPAHGRASCLDGGREPWMGLPALNGPCFGERCPRRPRLGARGGDRMLLAISEERVRSRPREKQSGGVRIERGQVAGHGAERSPGEKLCATSMMSSASWS